MLFKVGRSYSNEKVFDEFYVKYNNPSLLYCIMFCNGYDGRRNSEKTFVTARKPCNYMRNKYDINTLCTSIVDDPKISWVSLRHTK